ncbi:MAG: hypothetical protein CR972_01170 [Candidatus Moraniibacteriota bacterium]|nr:MAG: hypothetical protein CR972_01170 [Candidatus Moranbacteria bacterium]
MTTPHHFDISTSFENEEDILAKYAIEKGEKFTLLQGENKTINQQKVIDWIKHISPDSFSDTYLHTLILAPQIENDDTFAYVTTNSDNPRRWDIVVAMDAFHDGEKEVVYTLIHEFSHIVTLNYSQMQENENTLCHNFIVQEGCLQNDAYLNTFYNTFWKNQFDVYTQNRENNYQKNPNAFVTEYAATNPEEDIAESFASFVFHPNPKDINNIKNQKIAFFTITMN